MLIHPLPAESLVEQGAQAGYRADTGLFIHNLKSPAAVHYVPFEPP